MRSGTFQFPSDGCPLLTAPPSLSPLLLSNTLNLIIVNSNKFSILNPPIYLHLLSSPPLFLFPPCLPAVCNPTVCPPSGLMTDYCYLFTEKRGASDGFTLIWFQSLQSSVPAENNGPGSCYQRGGENGENVKRTNCWRCRYFTAEYCYGFVQRIDPDGIDFAIATSVFRRGRETESHTSEPTETAFKHNLASRQLWLMTSTSRRAVKVVKYDSLESILDAYTQETFSAGGEHPKRKCDTTQTSHSDIPSL